MWNFLIVESGKNNFQSSFLETWCSEFMGLLIFPIKYGGHSFPSSAVWKSRSYYTRELVPQQERDMLSLLLQFPYC